MRTRMWTTVRLALVTALALLVLFPFIYALLASFFSAGNPLMLGYKLAIPACNALTSASTPTLAGGRPGTPISIFTNSTPVSSSACAAIALISRIVAFE